MRRSEGALALIRRQRDGRSEYLVQWNEKWGAYSFVGGHRRPDETFRACLQRELAEELHLQPGTGYDLPDRPPWHLEYTAYSESAGVETAYVMELFIVELTPAGLAAVEADPVNRWVSQEQVRDRRAGDQRPVSRTVALLLDRIGLLADR